MIIKRQLTAGEPEGTSVGVDGIARENHSSAHYGHWAPGGDDENDDNDDHNEDVGDDDDDGDDDHDGDDDDDHDDDVGDDGDFVIELNPGGDN